MIEPLQTIEQKFVSSNFLKQYNIVNMNHIESISNDKPLFYKLLWKYDGLTFTKSYDIDDRLVIQRATCLTNENIETMGFHWKIIHNLHDRGINEHMTDNHYIYHHPMITKINLNVEIPKTTFCHGKIEVFHKKDHIIVTNQSQILYEETLNAENECLNIVFEYDCILPMRNLAIVISGLSEHIIRPQCHINLKMNILKIENNNSWKLFKHPKTKQKVLFKDFENLIFL